MTFKRFSPNMIAATALVLAGGLILSGCAESTLVAHSAKQFRMSTSQSSQQTVSSSVGVYKVGSPYQIQGKWYTPHEDFNYSEVGVASWYGPNFHGKRTANGEVYDMHAMTAAHRTLPLPSMVRVTNLSNGRSIIVRVNDRGPFAHNRILDLSKAGAQALDFIKQGTARVRVEILADESIALKDRIVTGKYAKAPQPQPVQVAAVHTIPATKPTAYTAEPLPPVQEPAKPVPAVAQTVISSPEHFIQVGAFGDASNAERLKQRLSVYGPVQITKVQTSSGVTLHKVRIGPIMDQSQVNTIVGQVQNQGFVDAHVIRPKT